MKKFTTVLIMIGTFACADVDFTGEQAPRAPAVTQEAPVLPQQGGMPPLENPGQDGGTLNPPSIIPTPNIPSPNNNSGPSFWDQVGSWWNGLNFNRGFEFGSGGEVFHLGNDDFAPNTDCARKLRLSTRPLAGQRFRFQFQVVEPNTTVNILIDEVCGVDRTNNLVKFLAGGMELTNYTRNLVPGSRDFKFSQMTLQPGWYEIQVISPDYDLNGNNDPDDFLVGKVKVKSDKNVVKGEVYAD